MTEIEELIQIKVSKSLINKAIKELKLNPKTPANYVVDNALRIFTEQAAIVLLPLVQSQIHRTPSTVLNLRLVEICNEVNALVGKCDFKALEPLKAEQGHILAELKRRRGVVLEASC